MQELAPQPVGRDVHTAVLLGGNIYVGGGYEGRSLDDDEDSFRLDVYNLTTNQWSPSITTLYCDFAKLISHKDFHKITSTCQYLKDDCLYLQIIKHHDDEHE